MKIVKINMGEGYKRSDQEQLEHAIIIEMDVRFKDTDEASNFNAKLIALIIEFKNNNKE